jgi:hypothetical protein
MSNPFDTDYASMDENDVGLDEESRKYTQPREEWLKMTKGQVLRGAFVYFHTVDMNTVARAKAAAKAKSETLSVEQMKAVGKKALEERAAALSKSVDQLSVSDRLDMSEARFKSLKGHYQQGLGYVISRLGKDGPDADAVWKKLDEPKQYFTTLLLLYPTNQKGDIGDAEKARIATDWRLIPWRFGKQQFERIWKLNAGLKENNLSIATQDIKLECKDAQYQNIEVTFAGAAIWQRNEKFKQMVLGKAIESYDKLIPFREMTTDQLRSKLGIGGPAVSDVAAGDFGDMLENV